MSSGTAAPCMRPSTSSRDALASAHKDGQTLQVSALRQKQTCAVHQLMSALVPKATAKAKFPQVVEFTLPPKADMCRALTHVRFVPIADNVR